MPQEQAEANPGRGSAVQRLRVRRVMSESFMTTVPLVQGNAQDMRPNRNVSRAEIPLEKAQTIRQRIRSTSRSFKNLHMTPNYV